MIELRWYTQIIKGDLRGEEYIMPKMLQYREGKKTAAALNDYAGTWTDWQDVPEVEDDD